jgi:hypothetical protein
VSTVTGSGPLLATLDRDDVAITIRTLNEITRRARFDKTPRW